METIAKKDSRRSTRRKVSLSQFGYKNTFMKKNDESTQIESSVHHILRDAHLYNQQSRLERMNPLLNREFNGSLIFGDETVDIGPSLRDNGDWYTELSDIADSIGMPITQIPINQLSLLETDWYRQLIKLVLYWEVDIWKRNPYNQFIWLQEDAVNERARKYLISNFKEIVLQVYDMIAENSEYDTTEVVEAGRKLIQSDEITFQCDFDSAQVTFSMKKIETIKTVASSPLLMEIMEKVTSLLKAYATDIIDYAVYKAVEKPM